MFDIPESEARALLQPQLLCGDPGEWIQSKEHPGAYRIAAGLTTREGKPTNMSVELQYLHAGSGTNFHFTVFLHETGRSQRVYQLEINQSRKHTRDRHRWSHEHVGDKRFLGTEQWDDWDYDEVFRYFCGQTNICFQRLPGVPITSQRRKK